jgi:hypothetical protein
VSRQSAPPPEHVAAIAAAIAVVAAERAAATADAAPSDVLTMWVEASRRSAQRSGLQRGPWRMSGRLGRRLRV